MLQVFTVLRRALSSSPRSSSSSSWPGSRRAPWIAGLTLALLGCTGSPTPHQGAPLSPGASRDDEAIEAAERDYFKMIVEESPETATALGVHESEDRLDDYSAHGFEAHQARLRKMLDDLHTRFHPGTQASLVHQTDLKLLEGSLIVQARGFALRRPDQTQPDVYLSPLNTLYLMIARDYAPAATRARGILARLAALPAVLTEGQKNLRTPPKLWTEIAQERVASSGAFLDDLSRFLHEALPQEATLIDGRIAAARAALMGFDKFLREDLMPRSTGSYVAGREFFDLHLKYDAFVTLTPDDLARLAHGWIDELQGELQTLAHQLDPSAKGWPEVVSTIQGKHPKADKLLDAYRAEVKRAREFLVQKGAVPFPVPDELSVVETPAFERSTISAAYDQPPPFDTSSRGLFYVTPVDTSASAADQEAMLRENDFGDIVDTVVHEAYPGHHLQLSFARQHPSLIRKITGTDVFAEGWGLYSEALMGELGYYTPEQHMMQLQWALVRATRVLLDVGLHTGTLSYEDAVKMLTDQVHLERPLAISEAKRYTEEPTQPMSYMLGEKLLLKLRERYQAKHGASATLLDFHREVLTHGTLAPGLLSLEILGEPLSLTAPPK